MKKETKLGKRTVTIGAYRLVSILCLVVGVIAGWAVAHTSDWIMCLIWAVSAVGGGCAGALWAVGEVNVWRLRWVFLEQDSAAAEGRLARNIDETFSVEGIESDDERVYLGGVRQAD